MLVVAFMPDESHAARCGSSRGLNGYLSDWSQAGGSQRSGGASGRVADGAGWVGTALREAIQRFAETESCGGVLDDTRARDGGGLTRRYWIDM